MKQGWKTVKLNDACFVDYGTRVVKKKDGGSIYPVYGGGGETFKMDTYNREDCLVVGRFAMSEKCTRFVKGRFFLNDSGLTVRAKDKDLSQSFLEWALVAKNDIIYSFGKGSAQKNLDMDDFRNMEFSYPTDLTEQQRIVEMLNTEFAKIDALKTNAEKNLQNAKDLFKASLNQAFEPKKDWNRISLAEVCAITSKLVDPQLDEYRSLLHIGGANIESETGRLIDLKTAEEEKLTSGKFVFNNATVLYNKIRPYLKKVARPDFSGLCSADMYPLTPSKIMNRDFLFYLLLTDDFTGYAIQGSARAGMPKVNRECLFAYECYVPSVEIQTEIANRLDDLNARCKTLQKNYEETITLCDDLKQAMLRKAFIGEL